MYPVEHDETVFFFFSNKETRLHKETEILDSSLGFNSWRRITRQKKKWNDHIRRITKDRMAEVVRNGLPKGGKSPRKPGKLPYNMNWFLIYKKSFI